MWSTPLHLEGAEEEIFYVLGGSGVSVQWEGEDDARATRSAPGDCLVHLPLENAHTLHAGRRTASTCSRSGSARSRRARRWLPRAGVAWLGETWAPVGAEDDHPWAREAAAGPPEVGELSPRPANIVNVDDVEEFERDGDDRRRGACRDLGRAAGSQRTGLKLLDVCPGS